MLSCEGTRFTEKKRLLSMKIAQEKGLPELKHHILPRTKGFTLLIQGAENRSKFVVEMFLRINKLMYVFCSSSSIRHNRWF